MKRRGKRTGWPARVKQGRTQLVWLTDVNVNNIATHLPSLAATALAIRCNLKALKWLNTDWHIECSRAGATTLSFNDTQRAASPSFPSPPFPSPPVLEAGPWNYEIIAAMFEIDGRKIIHYTHTHTRAAQLQLDIRDDVMREGVCVCVCVRRTALTYLQYSCFLNLGQRSHALQITVGVRVVKPKLLIIMIIPRRSNLWFKYSKNKLQKLAAS